MRKIKELKDLIKTKSKEEMDNEAIRIMDELIKNSQERIRQMQNDPMIIEARKEYEIRKSNGEWPDED
jgi:hypothetical protein